jgi:hypothetical protein
MKKKTTWYAINIDKSHTPMKGFENSGQTRYD